MLRKKYPETFKDIISGSLPDKLATRLPSQRLRAVWSDLVGETTAAKARPVALERGGILVVAVKGTIWRQELSFQVPELLKKLRKNGYNLRNIKLVMERGKLETPPPEPLPELNDQEEAEVQASVASVKDPKLRESLAGVRRAQMRARKGGRI